MNVNLDTVFKENYNEIKNGTYKWNENEIASIYKMAGAAFKKILSSEIDANYEDMVQDFVLLFFNNIISKYDISKNITISTYSYKAFRNHYYKTLRKSNVEIVSLQDKIDEDRELIDVLGNEDSINHRLRNAKLEIIERFKELNKNNQMVLDYFFLEEKNTLREIAKKYSVSGNCVAKRVNKAIDQAKKDPVIKRLI